MQRTTTAAAAELHWIEQPAPKLQPVASPDARWDELLQSREAQFTAMRTDLQARKLQYDAPQGALNFVSRFKELQNLFHSHAAAVASRSAVCVEALRVIYGIEPRTAPRPSEEDIAFLDKLALWAQEASDLLDEQLSRRIVGEVALSVATPAVNEQPTAFFLKERGSYSSALVAGDIGFTVTSSPFEQLGMKDPGFVPSGYKCDIKLHRPLPLYQGFGQCGSNFRGPTLLTRRLRWRQ